METELRRSEAERKLRDEQARVSEAERRARIAESQVQQAEARRIEAERRVEEAVRMRTEAQRWWEEAERQKEEMKRRLEALQAEYEPSHAPPLSFDDMDSEEKEEEEGRNVLEDLETRRRDVETRVQRSEDELMRNLAEMREELEEEVVNILWSEAQRLVSQGSETSATTSSSSPLDPSSSSSVVETLAALISKNNKEKEALQVMEEKAAKRQAKSQRRREVKGIQSSAWSKAVKVEDLLFRMTDLLDWLRVELSAADGVATDHAHGRSQDVHEEDLETSASSGAQEVKEEEEVQTEASSVSVSDHSVSVAVSPRTRTKMSSRPAIVSRRAMIEEARQMREDAEREVQHTAEETKSYEAELMELLGDEEAANILRRKAEETTDEESMGRKALKLRSLLNQLEDAKEKAKQWRETEEERRTKVMTVKEMLCRSHLLLKWCCKVEAELKDLVSRLKGEPL